MAGEFTSTTGAGNLKDIFAEIKDVRGVADVLQTLAPFDPRKPGGTYKFPAILSVGGGSVPSAFGTLPSSAVLAEGPVPAEVQFATAQGYNVSTPVVIPFDMMAASSNGGDAAYESVPDIIALTAKLGHERELEVTNLLGQFSLGAVASIAVETGITDTRLGAGFYRDVTFTPATWSLGLWSSVDRHRFDFFDTTGATQRNTLGACSVIAVQPGGTAKTVRFFYVTTLTMNGVVATDKVWRRNFKTAGVSAYSEALGLLGALSVTASATNTVWGLSTAYTQWSANIYDAGAGPLSFGKLAKALQPAIARAVIKSKKMQVLCAPNTWADLLRDLADLTRNTNPPPSTLKNGASSIEYTLESGPVQVVVHPYMPDGYAIAFPEGTTRRIGAQEPTTSIAGTELQVMSSTTNAVETRVYSNQAIINRMLGACTLIQNITNDA